MVGLAKTKGQGAIEGARRAGIRAQLDRMVELGWLSEAGADEVAETIDTIEDLVALGALGRQQADAIITAMAEDKADEWLDGLKRGDWAEVLFA